MSPDILKTWKLYFVLLSMNLPGADASGLADKGPAAGSDPGLLFTWVKHKGWPILKTSKQLKTQNTRLCRWYSYIIAKVRVYSLLAVQWAWPLVSGTSGIPYICLYSVQQPSAAWAVNLQLLSAVRQQLTLLSPYTGEGKRYYLVTPGKPNLFLTFCSYKWYTQYAI